MPVARQHLRDTQQWSNFEAVFSMRSVTKKKYVLQQQNCWEITVKDTPVLSSERAPHINKPAIV
jgi:hypothetical protein